MIVNSGFKNTNTNYEYNKENGGIMNTAWSGSGFTDSTFFF